MEHTVERRDVVAGRADVRVPRAERLLADRQGAEVERLHVAEPAELRVQ